MKNKGTFQMWSFALITYVVIITERDFSHLELWFIVILMNSNVDDAACHG